MDKEPFERMRVTFILAVVLVFGIFAQYFIFSDGTAAAVSDQKITEQKAALVEISSNNEDQEASELLKTEVLEQENDSILDNNVSGEDFVGDDIIGSNNEESIEEESIVMESNDKDLAVKEEDTFSTNALAQDTNPDFLPIRNNDVPDIDIAANAAIVVSIKDGKILYTKNIDDQLPIASLTKILVGEIVLENLALDDVVTMKKDIFENTEGIAGRFHEGEEISVEDLLKIMLVVSSNDAAASFANYLKETKDFDLIAAMNKRVSDLGLGNTHFSNPVGFDEGGDHYSSARDLSRIVLSTMENKKLWDIMSIKNELIKSRSPDFPDRRLITSNKLMFRNLDGLLGGKTGYTGNAGGCLVTAFTVKGESGRDDEILISIVLGTKDTESRFDEMEKLIRWVREAYKF
jgi:D-alanyl-D-alanine carboxypeptidase